MLNHSSTREGETATDSSNFAPDSSTWRTFAHMALEADWVFVPLAETPLIEDPQVYACAGCNAHLTTEGNVISKDFTTQNGRGFLVTSVINVTNGPARDTLLLTGLHKTEDVSCVSCGEMIGWEYKYAFDKSQRYKIGNFVVDMVKLVKCDWESDQGN